MRDGMTHFFGFYSKDVIKAQSRVLSKVGRVLLSSSNSHYLLEPPFYQKQVPVSRTACRKLTELSIMYNNGAINSLSTAVQG